MTKNKEIADQKELNTNDEGHDGDEKYHIALTLSKLLSYVGLSFLIAVIANVLILGFLSQEPYVYAVVPFNIAAVLTLAWLAKRVFGWIVGILIMFTIFLPPAFIIALLWVVNSVSKSIKSLGYKPTFTGGVKPT